MMNCIEAMVMSRLLLSDQTGITESAESIQKVPRVGDGGGA